jgi:LacI family repressor for deo operon, udp, cdd, tsx, nupC, and nupG
MAMTMSELARLVGVCPATVSRVLNSTGPVSEETRARVLAGVERYHYHPNELARGLVNGKSRSVGVIVSQLDNLFYAAVLMGIEQALSGAGYSWLLGISLHDAAREREHLQDLRRRKVDGIILNPVFASDGRYPNADLIHALQRDHVPLVVIQDYLRETDTSYVAYDIFSGVCQAIDYLVGLGHRRIGFISSVWKLPIDRTAAANDRVRGYLLGLNHNGLVFDPALTANAPETLEGGARAAETLLALPDPPTALLTHNDTVAIGAMHGVRAAGKRVPEDVSVVGFDDTDICPYLPVPLTSVALPKRELGQQAAALVLAAIGGEEEGAPLEKVSLPARLVVRASTGPAPAHGGLGKAQPSTLSSERRPQDRR